MNTFYFKDSEKCTVKVKGFVGTVDNFRDIMDRLNDGYISSDDDYYDFYEVLSKETKAVVEPIEISFTQ